MKKYLVLDFQVYNWLLRSINQLSLYEDRLGDESEFSFLRSNEWLGDTAVIDRLIYRRGEFRIDLIFAHHKQPLKFLVRNITVQSDRKKAEIMSQLFRRQAAKDQRGTLMIQEGLLNLDYN
ncbi:hypothetical protein [Cecembia rubra]|uniref:Uncharacterized protein n=1 Tax=Cecembia rubra TaxID=1485585 RepID=A0A2P8E317_9BACT|nr:hypothetical protein [Cecembia rubra]PSL03853.1 hypothetical protein CLV48_10693 [Cecembia rubra]